MGNWELPSVLDPNIQYIGKASLTQIFEDNRHFYMRFDYVSKPVTEDKGAMAITSGSASSYNYGVYSKETGDVKIMDKSGFQNDIDGGLSFFPKYIYNDSILVDWVDAFKLTDAVLNGNATEMRQKYGQKYDDLVKVTKGLKDDGATVLVLVQP
jgi:hypothetical protein